MLTSSCSSLSLASSVCCCSASSLCASEENGTAGQADLGGIGAEEGEEGMVEVEVEAEEIAEVVAEETVEGAGVAIEVVKVVLTCNKDKETDVS